MSEYDALSDLCREDPAYAQAEALQRIADHLDRCVCNHMHENGEGSTCSAKLHSAQVKGAGGEQRCQCPFHVPVLVAMTQRLGPIREQVQATIGLINVVAAAAGIEIKTKEEAEKPHILTPRPDGRFM